MSEKKSDDIPESYKNLGYDTLPVSSPSAPIEAEIEEDGHLTPEPSAPAFSCNENDNESGSISAYCERPLAGDLAPRIKPYSPRTLVFEEIYEACVKYAKMNSFHGTSFLNSMKLKKIETRTAYHYILENYGEKREKETVYSIHLGESINTSMNRSPPNPWDIEVQHPFDFKEQFRKLEIPNSTRIENCSQCQGSSKESCRTCDGTGKRLCWLCDGKGHDGFLPCFQCSGVSKLSCNTCEEKKQVTCRKCKGIGRKRETTFLIVSWKTHKSEFVTDTGSLPRKLIINAGGEIILQEEGKKLLPITECPDASVNSASTSLLQKGNSDFRNERIVYQRHTLQAKPYTIVTYKSNKEEGYFYVFGKERQVFFNVYPQDFSCICS